MNTVNDQYQEILFEISRQLTNGLIMSLAIYIPNNLIKPVEEYLQNKGIKHSLISSNNFNFLILDKDNSMDNIRFDYYKNQIEKFNKDIHRRKELLRLAIHPEDYKFNQAKIESLVDSSNLSSGFAEYIDSEFISGNDKDSPYLELKLESGCKSIERVIKEIDNYLNYIEDFDFNPIEFKISRGLIYEELVNRIESDRIKNYHKWFNFKFTSYKNGNLILVEKKKH